MSCTFVPCFIRNNRFLKPSAVEERKGGLHCYSLNQLISECSVCPGRTLYLRQQSIPSWEHGDLTETILTSSDSRCWTGRLVTLPDTSLCCYTPSEFLKIRGKGTHSVGISLKSTPVWLPYLYSMRNCSLCQRTKPASAKIKLSHVAALGSKN